jgi:predicted ribosomally synthesized peptide with nif11-like leader
MQAMLQLAESNKSFSEALAKCKSNEAVIALLKENGITTDTSELEAFKNAMQNQELDEDDLENVTGAGCVDARICVGDGW